MGSLVLDKSLFSSPEPKILDKDTLYLLPDPIYVWGRFLGSDPFILTPLF